MKQITAIIRPEKFEAVKAAMEKCGYPGVMIHDIEGHGKQKGVEQVWRGERFRMDLLPKMKLQIVVPDSEAEKLVQEIAKAAKTGNVGDGKIFISTVDEAVRIRTGERGEKAL
ncbi:MAG: transcriptional regulator [Omnitrophica bacterium RIFCSPHIGHO2_02_FULL_51_18]|nr:MAG: transcriptional regulator [Omnitrophica bacterium RIFCSPHIGHO2_02_FULL_51_18]